MIKYKTRRAFAFCNSASFTIAHLNAFWLISCSYLRSQWASLPCVLLYNVSFLDVPKKVHETLVAMVTGRPIVLLEADWIGMQWYRPIACSDFPHGKRKQWHRFLPPVMSINSGVYWQLERKAESVSWLGVAKSCDWLRGKALVYELLWAPSG